MLLYRKEKKGKEAFNMAIEKVKEYFRKFDMENRIQEFKVSSAMVELSRYFFKYSKLL